MLQRIRASFLILLLISALYFVVRLPNLTSQPIFADEAIYIRWAQVMRAEPTLRFVSLTDGKTPLFMWMMIPVFKVVADPLLAGRLLSVVFGYVTLLGVLAIGAKFVDKRVGLWAAFLVAVSPYMVFFDRMALVDSMLASFGVWACFFSLWLARSSRLDLAIILGFVLGGGILTKTPGYFNVMMSALALLSVRRKKVTWMKRLKLVGLFVVVWVISMGVYNMLRLGPGFSSLASRNSDYVHPWSRLWTVAFDPFLPHLKDLGEWLPILLTWPVILLVLAGVVAMVVRRQMVALVVLLWALVPLLVELALLKTFTTRYILPSIPLLLLVGAVGAEFILGKVKFRFKEVLLVGAVIIFAGAFLYYNLFDGSKLVLPRESKRGYFEEWTAGVGLREIAAYLDERSKHSKLVVGTQGSFGTLPDGLWIYFDKNPNVVIIGGKLDLYKDLPVETKDKETYFVVNSSRADIVLNDGLELVSAYPKLKGPDIPQGAMQLYRVREQ